MIIVKLRDAMEAYRRRTGKRMTYKRLAGLTGLASGTLEQIGSKLDYHPTLDTVERLCLGLDVPLHDMLEMIPTPPEPESEEPEPEPSPKKTKKKKNTTTKKKKTKAKKKEKAKKKKTKKKKEIKKKSKTSKKKTRTRGKTDE